MSPSRLLPVVLLACLAPLAACPQPDGDSGDTSLPCVPGSDPVAAGVYGAEHYQLTVAADGTAELQGDCSLATVDAVPVSEGAVHWTLSWRSGYGLPVEDTAAIEYQDVLLDGTYCGGEIAGTLTFPNLSTAEIDVVLGVSAEIYYCD